ncbi:hypothetical protein [Streptosporangium saharense]|uniref:hypothetical protein n=1 Tax=Streptosporangium saharense TaxID=1706840 RepID=UPI003333383A
MVAEARKALWLMVGFLALIWAVQVVNWTFGYSLSYLYGLRDIASAPFLHWSWEHIEANSGPLFIFGFLAGVLGGWLFRDRRPRTPGATSHSALLRELDDLGL